MAQQTQEETFKKIVAHCKEYGFVFPSSEIYDGLGAVYDYGQNGVELKNNIIRDISIMGDFFLVGDIDTSIIHSLRHVPFTREAVGQALQEDLGNVIYHLQKKPFIDFIFNQST